MGEKEKEVVFDILWLGGYFFFVVIKVFCVCFYRNSDYVIVIGCLFVGFIIRFFMKNKNVCNLLLY